MIDAGRARLADAGSRRAEVEVSVASDGVCVGELARLHPEVSQ